MYQTVPERLCNLAKEDPERVAFVFHTVDGDRQTVTREALRLTSLSLAKNFIKMGMQKGAIVGICMNNSINLLYVIFGVAFAGGIPYFLATNLRDGSDVIETLNDMKIEYLIIDANESDTNWQILENVWPANRENTEKVPSLCTVICNGSNIKTSRTRISLSELLQNPPPKNIDLPVLCPEDTLVCFATSGSTGKPKAVMVSHYAVLNYTIHCNIVFEINKETIYFCDRQFSWSVGFPRAYITDGCTRVFVDTRMTLSGKHVGQLCDIIEKEKVSVAYLPAYLITDLLLNEQYSHKFKNVKVVVASGERFKTAFLKLRHSFCKRLIAWYGYTESGSLVTFDSENNEDYEDGIIGKPHPGVEIKIIDDHGNAVPVGVSGEMCTRCTWRFTEYRGKPELFHEVVDSLGWFHTGDIAHIRSDDNIVVDGRQKELISMQTVKYFPWEIERILQKCSNVKYAIAVGVPDARLTNVICACVVPEASVNFTEKNLVDFCDVTFLDESTSAGLSLRPKYHLIFDELPLTSTGKIDRRKLGILVKQRLGL